MMFEYTLKRSKRKTIGIQISDSAEVIITAPLHAKSSVISRVIEAKSTWINSKLKVIEQRQQSSAPRAYSNGESFDFLGKAYPLNILDGSNPITLSNTTLSIGISKNKKSVKPENEFIQAKIIKWYRTQAQQYLDKRAYQLANEIGVNPILIKEKAFKRSWGMCHSNGKIFINYKLIMAPHQVIDYVIIHELCHLQHPNHSKYFWGLVAKHCPNYKEHRNWLKDNGHKLYL